MPEGSLLRPRHPAALGCRTHALTRLFDVLGGALTKQAPELNTAAGYGTSPYMLYSGWGEDGRFFYAMEILYGGIPGPADRRRDGRALVVAAVREHPDGVPRGLLPAADRRLHDGHRLRRGRAAPRRQRGREALRLPRAGPRLDPRRPLADAPVGRAGRRAGRALVQAAAPRRRDRGAAPRQVRRGRGAAGRHAHLPHRGRRRLEGPARPAGRGGRARRRVRAGVGGEGADRLRRRARPDGAVDAAATEAERARQRAERGDAPAFDFGPSLEETLAACEAETGLPAPQRATPLRWSPLEDGEAARARVRAAWEAEAGAP